jgi:hypothetical protein
LFCTIIHHGHGGIIVTTKTQKQNNWLPSLGAARFAISAVLAEFSPSIQLRYV